MAWYNNWSDLTGDIGDILHGKNPMNNAPPVGIPLGPGSGGPGGGGIQRMNTGQMMSGLATYMPDVDLSGVDQSAFEKWVREHGGGAIWDAVASGAGSIGDLAGWVLKNKDALVDAFKIYGGYQAQKQANQYGQEALALARQRYEAGKPLRDAAIPSMMNAQRANPFARDALPVAYGGMGGTPTTVAGTPAYGSGVGNAIMRLQGAPPPSTNNPIPLSVSGTTNPQRTGPMPAPTGPATFDPRRLQLAPQPVSPVV